MRLPLPIAAFEGNSGSGVFSYEIVSNVVTNVRMVGMLISGATDYVTTQLSWTGSGGGNCRSSSS